MLKELYWEVNYIDVYSTAVVDPTDTSTVSKVLFTAAPPNGTYVQRPTRHASASASATRSAVQSGKPNTVAAASGAAGAVKTGSASTKTASSPSSAISPVDSIVPNHNPASIDVYSYLGCFSSASGFSSFNLSGTDPSLTLEKCVGLCSGKKYAGALDSMCYCANTLDAGTGAVKARESCDKPCPGNKAEFCGASSSSSKRAALPNVLLSVYANINGLNSTTPPPAPALGSNTTNSTGSGAGNGVTATSSLQTVTSTVTYTTVCSTNPAQLVTLTYCTTIVVCPTSSPSIPQTILTQSCAGCGTNGSSVVTLTIPVQVAKTNTAYGVATATQYVNRPKGPSTTLVPVTAAAPPRGTVGGLLMTLLGFVGMLL